MLINNANLNSPDLPRLDPKQVYAAMMQAFLDKGGSRPDEALYMNALPQSSGTLSDLRLRENGTPIPTMTDPGQEGMWKNFLLNAAMSRATSNPNPTNYRDARMAQDEANRFAEQQLNEKQLANTAALGNRELDIRSQDSQSNMLKDAAQAGMYSAQAQAASRAGSDGLSPDQAANMYLKLSEVANQFATSNPPGTPLPADLIAQLEFLKKRMMGSDYRAPAPPRPPITVKPVERVPADIFEKYGIKRAAPNGYLGNNLTR